MREDFDFTEDSPKPLYRNGAKLDFIKRIPGALMLKFSDIAWRLEVIPWINDI